MGSTGTGHGRVVLSCPQIRPFRDLFGTHGLHAMIPEAGPAGTPAGVG